MAAGKDLAQPWSRVHALNALRVAFGESSLTNVASAYFGRGVRYALLLAHLRVFRRVRAAIRVRRWATVGICPILHLLLPQAHGQHVRQLLPALRLSSAHAKHTCLHGLWMRHPQAGAGA